MNNLSLFLYAADILPSFSTLFGLLGVVFGIGGGIGLIIWVSAYNYTVSNGREGEVVAPPKILYWVWAVVIFFGTLAVFIPDKETIYLIADRDWETTSPSLPFDTE